MVTKFIAELWEEKEIKDWTCDADLNPYITETAGFIPLDVQIQKFEQAGTRAKFTSDMFDSQYLRESLISPVTILRLERNSLYIPWKAKVSSFLPSSSSI